MPVAMIGGSSGSVEKSGIRASHSSKKIFISCDDNSISTHKKKFNVLF